MQPLFHLQLTPVCPHQLVSEVLPEEITKIISIDLGDLLVLDDIRRWPGTREYGWGWEICPKIQGWNDGIPYTIMLLLPSWKVLALGRLEDYWLVFHLNIYSMASYLPLLIRSIIFCFAMFVHHGNSPRLIHIYRVYLGCVHLFNFSQEKRPHSLVPAAKLEGIYGSNSKAWRYHSGSGDLGSPSCFLHVSNDMFF